MLEKVEGVRDSKKLSKADQRRLFAEIQEKSLYAVIPANVGSINGIGVYMARNLAIISACRLLIASMAEDPRLEKGKFGIDKIVIDGYWSQAWLGRISRETHKLPTEGIIRGDDKVYEIGAASIVARVYADSLFEGWNKFWPGFNINHNHGSPDKAMYAALYKKGPAPIFRTHDYAPGWWKRILREKYHQFFGAW